MRNNNHFDKFDDTIHLLSGISEITFRNDYCEEEDGILITIDGKNYFMGVDPDDGWRSYGSLFEVTDKDIKQKFSFPAENVQIIPFKKEGYDIDTCECVDKMGIVIRNIQDGSIIVEIGTDYSDGYYPCAIFRYYPENLQYNKDIAELAKLKEELTKEEMISIPMHLYHDLLHYFKGDEGYDDNEYYYQSLKNI